MDSDDIQIERRIDDLVERGLDRYGAGDMEGALAQWRHALALDPGHERAANYLEYVEEHHDLAGEETEALGVELAYPFGVASLGLARLTEEELADYESFEIIELAPMEPAVVATVTAPSVDDGWNVDEGWVQDLVANGEDAFTSKSAAKSEHNSLLSNVELASLVQAGIGTVDLALEGDVAVESDTAVTSTDTAQVSAAISAIDDLETLEALEALEDLEDEALEDLDDSFVTIDFRSRQSADSTEAFERVEFERVDLDLRGEDTSRVDRSSHLFELEGLELDSSEAPLQDHSISPSSIAVDDALLSLQEATHELDLGGMGLAGSQDACVQETLDFADSGEATASTDSGILAEITREAPRGDSNERTKYIVGKLLEHANQAYDDGQLASASASVRHALDYAADNASAQLTIFESERRLIQILVAALGEAGQVPKLTCALTDIPGEHINSRAAFLLTRLDASMTLDELLDVSGMPKLEALQHLCALHELRFLELT